MANIFHFALQPYLYHIKMIRWQLQVASRISFLWLFCFMTVFVCAGSLTRPRQSPCTSLYIEQSRGIAQTHSHPDSPSRQLLIHFQMFPVLLLQEPKKNMKRETYSLQLNKLILVQLIIISPFKV